MNIHNISKNDKQAIVSLSSDELVLICNLLYKEQDQRELYVQLYSQMMIARDMCQYGHIDDFCLSQIVKCRGYEKIKKNIEYDNESESNSSR